MACSIVDHWVLRGNTPERVPRMPRGHIGRTSIGAPPARGERMPRFPRASETPADGCLFERGTTDRTFRQVRLGPARDL